MSAYQASFLFSANGGSGVLLRHDKKENKWSPPCAIGLGGAGVGIQAGIEKKSVIMFLSEKAAMKTASGEFQLRVGSQITLTLGPEGEEDDFYAHFSNRGVASTSSFAHTKGLAFGISFEGGVITPRFKTIFWRKGFAEEDSVRRSDCGRILQAGRAAPSFGRSDDSKGGKEARVQRHDRKSIPQQTSRQSDRLMKGLNSTCREFLIKFKSK